MSYSGRQHGTMADFVARHPMVVRRLTYFSAHYFAINGFNYKTNVQNYSPDEEISEDDVVVKYIQKIMLVLNSLLEQPNHQFWK